MFWYVFKLVFNKDKKKLELDFNFYSFEGFAQNLIPDSGFKKNREKMEIKIEEWA